jgi:hypothetical protein
MDACLSKYETKNIFLKKILQGREIRSLIIRTRQQISNIGLVCLTATRSWRRGDIGVGLLLCMGDSGAGFLCVHNILDNEGKNKTTYSVLLFDYLCCRVTRLPASGSGLTW